MPFMTLFAELCVLAQTSWRVEEAKQVKKKTLTLEISGHIKAVCKGNCAQLGTFNCYSARTTQSLLWRLFL